jgi:hypothetical protein
MFVCYCRRITLLMNRVSNLLSYFFHTGNQTYFILCTHDPSLYDCSVVQTIRSGEKIQMMHMDFFNRIFVLDAPCGTGKTYTMSQVVKQALDTSVFVPTPRRALEISLGNQLDLNVYCILTHIKNRIGVVFTFLPFTHHL